MATVAQPARPGKSPQLQATRRAQVAWTAALFLLPTILGLVLFQFGPLLVAVRNSLYRVSLLNPDAAQFVGASNYLRLIEDETFWIALLNTVLYMVGKLVVQIPLGLGASLLVNQKLRGIVILRSALFAPVVTSGAVIAVIWNLMYYPENGLFNAILNAVGIPSQPFLTSPTQALASIVIMGVWMDLGFTMLLYLGGLQGISETYYEAAAIDGASPRQQFWAITLPLLRRTTMLAIFMGTIVSFRVFTPIYVMTQGGPQDSTINSVYFMYLQAFKFMSLGYASAVAVVVIVVLAAITFVQSRLLSTDLEY
ncbi:MAG: sugar ABC transporter permease [Chloroflexota bacterium]